MTTIRAGESFTINQVLNKDGFTLDTTDFIDIVDEEDEANHIKNMELNNAEMLELLNIKDETDDKNKDDKPEDTPFVGICFNSIKSKMTSIFGEGQVLKLLKTEGVGEVVPSNAQVTIEYVGYFEYQDEPFDSTFFQRDKTKVIQLGRGEVIVGLEICVSSMKKHETSIFLIQPKLAYGALGCLPRIPPNSEVLFKIRLIDYIDNGCADMYDELDHEERKQFLKIEKIVVDIMTTAHNNVNRQKITQAVREYNRAIDYLESASLNNDAEEERMNKLLCRALTNLTVLYNKLQKPKHVCAAFQKLPKKNGKAFFQNGKALALLGEYNKSMNSLQQANKLLPECEDIIKEIQKVEDLRQLYKEYFKRFAQNSLKLTNKTKVDTFEQIVHEMCESFNKNKQTLRQQLPIGLSIEEQECIRRVAASYNLSITKQNRYGVETLYLTSNGYYTREMI